MQKAELRVLSGKQLGTVIALKIGKFLVGREVDCDLRPNSDMVSRHHCVFTLDEYSVRIRDLGSTNGTQLNGETMRSTQVLKPGDRVTIGKLDFIVVIDGDAGSHSLDETTIASAEETLQEIPKGEPAPNTPDVPIQPAAAQESAMTLSDLSVLAEDAEGPPPVESDTQYIPSTEAPQQPVVQAPPVGVPQGMTPPPGYPPQYQYPPPGYPPQYQYPPPGYPGYPPQQPYYPYPPQGAPPAGYPPQQQTPPEAASPPIESSTKEMSAMETENFRLPDPSTTGAKAPEPPAPKKESDGDDSKKEEHIPTKAQEIISQYLGRRPTPKSK